MWGNNCVKCETEVATLGRSGLIFIHLVGVHIENAIKLTSLNQGKLKISKIRQNAYPVETKLLQNNLLRIKITRIQKNCTVSPALVKD